ncbi:MAG: ABC transporter ATP-binding protein [Acetatifactor sp.]|nr:ABC transporter ATP-binding protein [Acetatifactor sp.]
MNHSVDIHNSIEISNLNKFYGKKQALRNVSLSIHQGMFGLLGRNGAGKTTLMKTLATLLQKKDGEITVCGIPIENAKEVRRIIGYLPQEFSMYPSMSVAETMNYLGILSGLSSAERKERAGILLKKVNLEEHKNKKIKALSGGMKRRLGIAQALLNNPKVLIVDEPTAGLDPEERVRFRNLLSEIAEDRIVILSTHIVGDIEATCEDIAILDDGKVLYNGTVDDLLSTAQGKVFTKAVERQELPKLKQELTITGMHTQGKKVYVRFLSENGAADAEVSEPNIEDAYMLYLNKNGIYTSLGEEEFGGGI